MSRPPVLRLWFVLLVLLLTAAPVTAQNEVIPTKRQSFDVAGHKAFVIEPPETKRGKGPLPWVWFAPTLGNRYPGNNEQWMFQRFLQAGIAIAGIDVGESYGSPKGRSIYQKLYLHLTSKRGYGKKPVLLARSRGGLMLYNWAVEHPRSVGGIAGIYPVCNLTSYPGLERASRAYELTTEQMKAMLTQHNPVDRLAPLAKAKVAIFHVHGDKDKVVPLKANSALLESRYKALGGPIEIEVIQGQGHNLWRGWFEHRKLTDFVIAQAKSR